MTKRNVAKVTAATPRNIPIVVNGVFGRICVFRGLTRIRRNYVFKSVDFYIYHDFETAEGSSTGLRIPRPGRLHTWV
jgi:hypothetical protein